MTKNFKLIIALLVGMLSIGSLTACAPEKIDMASVAQVIDVRTPEEFATGYLESAVNLPLFTDAFYSELDLLDKSANYVIYCRSGHRAGQAIDYMTESGFTGTLTNGGSVEAASSLTGLALIIEH